MSHFKKVCTKCGTVVSQCRCPSKDKTIIDVICDRCKDKGKKKPKVTRAAPHDGPTGFGPVCPHGRSDGEWCSKCKIVT